MISPTSHTCNVFAICGDSGSGKTTMASVLASYLKDSTVVECDRYHKWERGDAHWDTYTHLNLEANHIDQMIEDVNNLKLGLDIYRKDYDHATGKFTEDKKIKASENIVVCGLHTFYCDKEVFDLKIFMDTDEELKTQWKIFRDTSKRGYSPKKVKEQIVRRKTDYSKYLQPLIKDADLVVNFCNEKNTSHVDSVKGIGRKLKLYIKEPYDSEAIVHDFSKRGVTVFLSESSREGYLQLELTHYKQIDKNYYYDYIMICILDMVKTKCRIGN
tara:strand:- start:268 stop:1083 length:816 start_codon:yes stop_codon:yes gene_type:complete